MTSVSAKIETKRKHTSSSRDTSFVNPHSNRGSARILYHPMQNLILYSCVRSPCLTVSLTRETLCTACLGFSLANQQIYSSHGNMTPSKQSATEHQQWHWQQQRHCWHHLPNFRESFVLMLFKYV